MTTDPLALFEQAEWPRNPEVAEQEIGRTEAQLGVHLPMDYKRFLEWSAGGEGDLGEAFGVLFSLREVRDANDARCREHFPGLVQIGGNEGLEAYCLDYRACSDAPAVVAVDRNSADPGDIWPVGSSFTEVMYRLSVAGDPWGPGKFPGRAPEIQG